MLLTWEKPRPSLRNSLTAKLLTRDEARRIAAKLSETATRRRHLTYINTKRPEPRHKATMAAFLYRCPATGFFFWIRLTMRYCEICKRAFCEGELIKRTVRSAA